MGVLLILKAEILSRGLKYEKYFQSCSMFIQHSGQGVQIGNYRGTKNLWWPGKKDDR